MLISTLSVPEEPVSTYVFVVDPITGIVQAQSVDLILVGRTLDWDSISSTLQVEDILNEIRRGTGMWVTYDLVNPVSGKVEDKRTWLIMHDGLVFGSGYYTSGRTLPAAYLVGGPPERDKHARA